jgi:hypothetical protein
MIEDEIVREVRAAREAFAASHGYDVRKMVAALHDVGVATGRELISLSPRPVIRPNVLPSRSPQAPVSSELFPLPNS